MNNNVMLFLCKDNIVRIDITYTIYIPKYDKTYTGTSRNSYITINTGNHIKIDIGDEIYVNFIYNGETYNKYYNYLGDAIVHEIDIKDPLRVLYTLDYVTNNNVYDIKPTLDTNNNISYIRYKLLYSGGLASEVGDIDIEDILLIDTTKDVNNTLRVYFLKDGLYKLIFDIVDINNNIKTYNGDDIVIERITDSSITSGSGYKNKIYYIEWE